ncbi:uncharacterized protein LOC119543877 [Choloepus didactylus]|uniref:uncharacterized protein LOC119543877 n=1 Tax=Choloepus didactylus TaxID=27675 RepID=UPI00189D00C2|nr:uncharacterized protein LOC119543877 [Choloepus didactylus]
MSLSKTEDSEPPLRFVNSRDEITGEAWALEGGQSAGAFLEPGTRHLRRPEPPAVHRQGTESLGWEDGLLRGPGRHREPPWKRLHSPRQDFGDFQNSVRDGSQGRLGLAAGRPPTCSCPGDSWDGQSCLPPSKSQPVEPESLGLRVFCVCTASTQGCCPAPQGSVLLTTLSPPRCPPPAPQSSSCPSLQLSPASSQELPTLTHLQDGHTRNRRQLSQVGKGQLCQLSWGDGPACRPHAMAHGPCFRLWIAGIGDTGDEYDGTQRVQMSCGHGVDPGSLTAWCRSLIDQDRDPQTCPVSCRPSQGRFKLHCPADVNGGRCGAERSYPEVRRCALLDDAEQGEFERKLALTAARLYCDFKECPSCKSLVERKDLSVCVENGETSKNE